MKPKVLFLCTGNSARSQMAEGYLRQVAGSRFEVLSAGTNPTALHPLVVQVMREAGIDISAQHSKDVREFLDTPIPYVVTVCSSARQKCPVFPATVRSLHWDLDDPAAATGAPEEKLTVFRRVRDEIIANINREFAESPEGAS